MLRTRALRTMLIAILVAAVAAPAIGSSNTAAQDEQVYLALGDSIAAGLSTSLPRNRGYPAIIQDLMQAERAGEGAPGAVQLINLAKPGETTESFIEDGQLDEALERIAAIENDSRELRTVTLTIGGNDILDLWNTAADQRDDGFAAFEQSFAEIIDELSDALNGIDADVVVTTYYDLTEGDADVAGSDSWWLAAANDVIRETATDAGFDVVDLDELFRGEITSLTWFPADVHPNNAGHQVIARAIWQELAYDEQPPAVEITRPDSSQVTSRVPTIHAEVSDNVEVERVELHVDGELVDELIYVTRLDAWAGLWDGRDHPGTGVEIEVVATDLSGNEARDSVSIDLPSR